MEQNVRKERPVSNINEDEFERVIAKSESPLVVDFYADWCGPCKVVSPIIEELSKEYAGRVSFAKVDTDDNQDLAARYNVMGIPTVMIFVDAHVVDRLVGAAPAQEYRRRIDSVLMVR
jgi:thioredoxin 1